MKHPCPLDREFWIEPERKVIPFPGSVARADAAHLAQSVEDDRVTFEVCPTRAEERRLWNVYMATIRKSVAVQDEVNEAHRAWMNFADNIPNSTEGSR